MAIFSDILVIYVTVLNFKSQGSKKFITQNLEFANNFLCAHVYEFMRVHERWIITLCAKRVLLAYFVAKMETQMNVALMMT